MDMQRLVDTISDLMQQARSGRQMTMGEAIDALSAMNGKKPIMYADGKAPREAMSYRGYYCDLAFDDQDAATVGEVLTQLQFAIGSDMTGYKGGEYTMTESTPIWRSQYGQASGIAWSQIVETPEFTVIITEKEGEN